MKKVMQTLVLAAAVTGCAASLAAGQDTKPAAPAVVMATPNEEVVVRVYNVSDLVSTARNYPYRSSIVPPTRLNGNGNPGHDDVAWSADVQKPKSDKAGGGDQEKSAGGGVGMEQLANLIRTTIAPSSWMDNGGSAGAIVAFGPGLVVTQTPANHTLIEGLLRELRSEVGLSARTVSVRLAWLMVEPGALNTYLKPQPPGASGPPVINWQAVDAASGVLKYDARVTCYSGQTVSLASGRGQSVVTALQPVVGTQAAMYDIQSTLVHSGMVVELTPQLTKDDVATLDVRAVASDVTVPSTQPAGPGTAVDRVNALAQQLSTTVRLPVNTPVLVGGMTLEPVDGAKDRGQLYLVAEVRP